MVSSYAVKRPSQPTGAAESRMADVPSMAGSFGIAQGWYTGYARATKGSTVALGGAGFADLLGIRPSRHPSDGNTRWDSSLALHLNAMHLMWGKNSFRVKVGPYCTLPSLI